MRVAAAIAAALLPALSGSAAATSRGNGGGSEQHHLLGALVKAWLGNHWALNLSYLAGMSASAPDDTYRLLVTRNL